MGESFFRSLEVTSSARDILNLYYLLRYGYPLLRDAREFLVRRLNLTHNATYPIPQFHYSFRRCRRRDFVGSECKRFFRRRYRDRRTHRRSDGRGRRQRSHRRYGVRCNDCLRCEGFGIFRARICEACRVAERAVLRQISEVCPPRPIRRYALSRVWNHPPFHRNDSFVPDAEAELLRDGFKKVELATRNVGSTLTDLCDHCFAVGGISDDDFGSERKCFVSDNKKSFVLRIVYFLSGCHYVVPFQLIVRRSEYRGDCLSLRLNIHHRWNSCGRGRDGHCRRCACTFDRCERCDFVWSSDGG